MFKLLADAMTLPVHSSLLYSVQQRLVSVSRKYSLPRTLGELEVNGSITSKLRMTGISGSIFINLC